MIKAAPKVVEERRFLVTLYEPRGDEPLAIPLKVEKKVRLR